MTNAQQLTALIAAADDLKATASALLAGSTSHSTDASAADPLTDLDAEVSIVGQGVDPADDLVTGNDRRDLAGHVMVAVEL